MSTSPDVPAPDPMKGLRGVQAATLVLQAVVTGLALPVIATTGAGTGSTGFTLTVVLLVLFILAAGLQRRPWGLNLALALQVAMIACGLFSLTLGVLGVIFAAVWGYFLWMRREVTDRMAGGRTGGATDD